MYTKIKFQRSCVYLNSELLLTKVQNEVPNKHVVSQLTKLPSMNIRVYYVLTNTWSHTAVYHQASWSSSQPKASKQKIVGCFVPTQSTQPTTPSMPPCSMQSEPEACSQNNSKHEQENRRDILCYFYH